MLAPFVPDFLWNKGPHLTQQRVSRQSIQRIATFFFRLGLHATSGLIERNMRKDNEVTVVVCFIFSLWIVWFGFLFCFMQKETENRCDTTLEHLKIRKNTLNWALSIIFFTIHYQVYTKPHYHHLLTSYELFLGHHELMMRFCVDWDHMK